MEAPREQRMNFHPLQIGVAKRVILSHEIVDPRKLFRAGFTLNQRAQQLLPFTGILIEC